MKKWQRRWLYFLIGYSLLHLMRDILQDRGIRVFLSTILVKSQPYKVSEQVITVYWLLFNTYLLESLGILISVFCLFRKKFGTLGYLTFIGSVVVLAAWIIYWFLF